MREDCETGSISGRAFVRTSATASLGATALTGSAWEAARGRRLPGSVIVTNAPGCTKVSELAEATMAEQHPMKTTFVRSSRLILVLLFAVLATACLDNSKDSTGPEPPPEEEGEEFNILRADSTLSTQR